ncbi:hypothetical protein KJ810_01330 [Patescibacteria group bacterium]|nr:hypothetical protein [Patescibacteria group bacterium]
MNYKINNIFMRNDGGKNIVIIIAVAVVLVILAVIYLAMREEKTPLEELVEDKAKIIEEQENMSENEQEDKVAMISGIKSAIGTVMNRDNNLGFPYLKDTMVDRRVTEREEYFAIVEFNADEYEVVSDYGDKVLKDLAAIKLKCAEFFKAVYENEHKIYLATCKAFQSDDDLREVYKLIIAREASEGVDWSQNIQTLVSEILPSVWLVDINEFWLYE